MSVTNVMIVHFTNNNHGNISKSIDCISLQIGGDNSTTYVYAGEEEVSK